MFVRLAVGCLSSGLQTTDTRWRVRIQRAFGAAVHRLAAAQHSCRGLFVSAANASFPGDLQINLPRDNGDDHNDGADTERPNDNGEVLRHGEFALYNLERIGCETTRGCLATLSRFCRIDTILFTALGGLVRNVTPYAGGEKNGPEID